MQFIDGECDSLGNGEGVPTCLQAQQIAGELEIACNLEPESEIDCCLMVDEAGVLPGMMGIEVVLGSCDHESGSCIDANITPTCEDGVDNDDNGDTDCEDNDCEETDACVVEGGTLPCHGMLSCEDVMGDCTLALFNDGEPVLPDYTCDGVCCADSNCDSFPQDSAAAETYELLADLMGLTDPPYELPPTCDGLDCCFFYGIALSIMNETEISLVDPDPGTPGDCCQPDCGGLPSAAAMEGIGEICDDVGLGGEGICCVDPLGCGDTPSNMWSEFFILEFIGFPSCDFVTEGPDDCCLAWSIFAADPPLFLDIDPLMEGAMCCEEAP